MARENQGLQIALIIFVMITIVLGVTVFLVVRKNDEREDRAKAAERNAEEQRKSAETANTECEELKRIMGAPGKKTEDVKADFAKDMEVYASKEIPDESKNYIALMKTMFDSLEVKKDSMDGIVLGNRDLKKTLELRAESNKPQIEEFQKVAKQEHDDRMKEAETYATERARITRDSDTLSKQLEKVRKDASARQEEAMAKAAQVSKELALANARIIQQATDLGKKVQTVPERPAGQIDYVSQQRHIVWINVGQADGLTTQITFAVYPKDVSNVAKAKKKASIEVTRVSGPKLAEARILDDNISDPILPGDKIYTPLWQPGVRRHFALCGLLDLDGDGRSDLATIIKLIKDNNGDVDAYIDEKGELQGELKNNTSFLVMGEEPNTKAIGSEKDDAGAKGQSKAIGTYSKLISQADRLGIPKISLAQMKQQMGYRSTNVQRFGPAGAGDFKPRAPEGKPKVSSGNVSDVFQKRAPPGHE